MIDSLGGLSRQVKGRVWVRCILAALVVSVAFGIGLYSVAPDGGFEMGPGAPSHDPHKYLWFFQLGLGGLYLIVLEGTIFGPLASLPIAIPLACVAGTLLSYVKPFRNVALRVVSMQQAWFVIAAFVVGWVIGLSVTLATLATGVFPGLCC